MFELDAESVFFGFAICGLLLSFFPKEFRLNPRTPAGPMAALAVVALFRTVDRVLDGEPFLPSLAFLLLFARFWWLSKQTTVDDPDAEPLLAHQDTGDGS